MRTLLKYMLAITIAATVFSCKKDNYDPPNVTLTGRLVYQGDSIQLEKGAVTLQIYQYGFGRVGPISESFAQDGSYSALLFNGDYKLTVSNGDGPFMWSQKTPGVPDSISVSLSGNQTVDLEVTPYYLIHNAQLSAAGTDSVHAAFKVDKIITDSANAKNIDYVALYINKTQFVSGNNNIASVSMAGSAITDMSNVQMGIHIPAMIPTQNYVFARVGLKIVDVEDLIFSPLFKIQL